MFWSTARLYDWRRSLPLQGQRDPFVSFSPASSRWLVLDCNLPTASRSTIAVGVCVVRAPHGMPSSAPTVGSPTSFSHLCRPRKPDRNETQHESHLSKRPCANISPCSSHEIFSGKEDTDFGWDHRYGASANPSEDIIPRVRASSEYLTRRLALGDCVYGKLEWIGHSVRMH